MQSVVVSIIIPSYNQASFLKEALKSVLSQTYHRWEAIVINNYSEDDTVQVVREFSDKRIRLVNFKNNGIIASSRNEGIRLASGEYIAFLDSDDVWFPQKLERCLLVLQSGYCFVCHAEIWRYTSGLRKIKKYGPFSDATYEKLLYKGNCLSTSAVVVRKKIVNLLNGFSQELKFMTSEDYELWLRIVNTGIRPYFIDEVLGEYRVHEKGASRNVVSHTNAILAVVERHHLAKNKNILDNLKYKKRRSQIMRRGSLSMSRNTNFKIAFNVITKSILEYPLNLKSYIVVMYVFVLLSKYCFENII